jgi:hypothetical protein
MIDVRLSTRIEGRELVMVGNASLATPQVTEALSRGELQVAGSYLWLSLEDVQFFGTNGQRIRPEPRLLEQARLLLVSGLECTLKPLPEG